MIMARKRLTPEQEFMRGCDIVAKTDPETAQTLRDRYYQVQRELAMRKALDKSHPANIKESGK